MNPSTLVGIPLVKSESFLIEWILKKEFKVDRELIREHELLKQLNTEYNVFVVSFAAFGVMECLDTNRSMRGISIKLVLAVFWAKYDMTQIKDLS